MHGSTPEVQSLFRRFLRALFAVSSETVDDIRFLDPLNRRHLDLIPGSLIEMWREGKLVRADGSYVYLPGYNDPQTLFMMGEDCNTCMAIRAKQKGTNRGLLSFLLHGNCRVLGKKTDSGALTTRAVVQLLADEVSNTPVLYMHSPQGDYHSFVEVWHTINLSIYLCNTTRAVGLRRGG